MIKFKIFFNILLKFSLKIKGLISFVFEVFIPLKKSSANVDVIISVHPKDIVTLELEKKREMRLSIVLINHEDIPMQLQKKFTKIVWKIKDFKWLMQQSNLKVKMVR